jgi:hypothetical protein
MGTQIDSFSFGKVMAGEHSFMLNTLEYAAGIYFYTLHFEGAVSTQKMVIIK